MGCALIRDTFPQPFRLASDVHDCGWLVGGRGTATSSAPLAFPLFTFSEKEWRRQHLVTHPGPFQKEKSYRQATDATLQARCVVYYPCRDSRVQLLVARQVQHALNKAGDAWHV